MTSSKIGLFSTIVAAFILEFYKTLSPDSGDQTVALLGRISKQLADFPNGTSPSIPENQPFSPSAPMVWIIAILLISLVLSLTSALLATMLQQWARTYIETPHVPSETENHARVRAFLFLGTELYKMHYISQMAFELLHISLFLFFVSLVILFRTINDMVAMVLEIAAGLFVLAYLTLSILPCLDVRCPYRTPMTFILWYQIYFFLSFAALCLRWFMELLHGCLVQSDLNDSEDGHMPCKQRVLAHWLVSRENAVRTYYRYFRDGLGKSVIYDAINTQGYGDRKIVARLFNLLSLGDKSKLRKLAAIIPRNRVLELIPLIESGTIVLQESFCILLQAAGTRLAGPDEEERKRSLRVCLDAIHHIAKAPNVPDLNFVLTNFANIELIRALWGEGDATIRFTSRSICALLAKKVVREPLKDPQLRWLHDVTGAALHAIRSADNITRDHMNFKSFVYGVLTNQVGDLSTENATSFKETLGILFDMGSDAHFDTPAFQTRLSEEVEWIQQSDSEGTEGIREVVDKLRSMFPLLSPAPPPGLPLSLPPGLPPGISPGLSPGLPENPPLHPHSKA